MGRDVREPSVQPCGERRVVVRAPDGEHTTGRQGNFRYNNMDQSVEMGRKMAGEISSGLDTGHEAVATGEEYFG